MAIPAAMAAGAGVGIITTLISNRTQWEYLRGQAREMRAQADLIHEVGAAEIRLFNRTAQYRTGAIEASWGHSGIAADSGSAFESLMAQAAVHGLTRLQMQRSTDIQARNILVSAEWMDYQRKILDRQLPLQMLAAGVHGAAAGTPSLSADAGGAVPGGNAGSASLFNIFATGKT